jgi:hypothetical protein
MSSAGPPKLAAASMEEELKAAGDGLVGNADVLRSVLAGCGDCIKILDLEGRLQFMSEGGKRVMEVEDFGRLKGCAWPDLWAGAGNGDAKNAVATAIGGGVARFRGAADRETLLKELLPPIAQDKGAFILPARIWNSRQGRPSPWRWRCMSWPPTP